MATPPDIPIEDIWSAYSAEAHRAMLEFRGNGKTSLKDACAFNDRAEYQTIDSEIRQFVDNVIYDLIPDDVTYDTVLTMFARQVSIEEFIRFMNSPA